MKIISGKSRIYAIIIFLILWLSAAITALQTHSDAKVTDYKSVIWADKGGYYVYLPATFIHQFDAKAFPKGIDTAVGHGFELDAVSGKITTRYTYVVALLQAPFFAFVHLFVQGNGFEQAYTNALDVGASFYFTAAIFLLFYAFRRYGNISIIAAIASVVLGSNLFYYASNETMMAHVYGFFLLSLYLYILLNWKKRHLFVLAIVAAGVIVLRPTNIIFVLLFPLVLFPVSQDGIRSLIISLRAKDYALFFLGLIVPVIPQLFYWKYLSGSFLYNSYQGYGFNFTDPQLIKSWFSTDNGLFLYSPIYLGFVLVMLFGSLRYRKGIYLYSLACFLIAAYVFSSWQFWNFGCGLGQRSYIEFSVIMVPVLQDFFQCIRHLWMKYLGAVLIIWFMAFNITLSYNFYECFTHGEWSWKHYFALVEQTRMAPFLFKEQKQVNDFEDAAAPFAGKNDYKGKALITPDVEYGPNILTTVAYPDGKLTKLSFGLEVFEGNYQNALMVLEIKDNGKQLYYQMFNLYGEQKLQKNNKLNFDLAIDFPLSKNAELLTYIWNPGKETLCIDNLWLAQKSCKL